MEQVILLLIHLINKVIMVQIQVLVQLHQQVVAVVVDMVHQKELQVTMVDLVVVEDRMKIILHLKEVEVVIIHL